MTDKQRKKSKNFWLISIFVCTFLLLASGYAIYEKLNIQSLSSGPIMTKSVPKLPDIKQTSLENDLIEQNETQTKQEEINESSKNKDAETEKIKNINDEKKIKAVKTVFEYKSPKAKSVEIAGSFTKWEKRKMKKEGDLWKTELWILPGNYLYHFVVDGKKTLAPSKPRSPIGESILEVREK